MYVMKAAIYARISARNGNCSITEQVKACQDFADKNSITVVHIYQDDNAKERPQYDEIALKKIFEEMTAAGIKLRKPNSLSVPFHNKNPHKETPQM